MPRARRFDDPPACARQGRRTLPRPGRLSRRDRAHLPGSRRSAGDSDHERIARPVHTRASSGRRCSKPIPRRCRWRCASSRPSKPTRRTSACSWASSSRCGSGRRSSSITPTRRERLGAMMKQGLIPFDELAVLYVLGRFTLTRTAAPGDLVPFLAPDMPRFVSVERLRLRPPRGRLRHRRRAARRPCAGRLREQPCAARRRPRRLQRRIGRLPPWARSEAVGLQTQDRGRPQRRRSPRAWAPYGAKPPRRARPRSFASESSLMPVFARVCASTVLTITAQ